MCPSGRGRSATGPSHGEARRGCATRQARHTPSRLSALTPVDTPTSQSEQIISDAPIPRSWSRCWRHQPRRLARTFRCSGSFARHRLPCGVALCELAHQTTHRPSRVCARCVGGGKRSGRPAAGRRWGGRLVPMPAAGGARPHRPDSTPPHTELLVDLALGGQRFDLNQIRTGSYCVILAVNVFTTTIIPRSCRGAPSERNRQSSTAAGERSPNDGKLGAPGEQQ